MKRMLVLVATVVGALAYAGIAQAATATLSGTAVVEGDHVKIVSDFSDDPGNTTNNGGAVSFTGTGVTDFNSLTTLSAEFNVTDDACLGGSPRFEVDFAGTDNNLFVYLGTFNATTGQFDCAPNTWITSGNLIGTPDTDKRYDTSKFAGGTFYDTYAHAKELLGSMAVESIRFVADAGWAFADKEQTVLLRTATVNQHVFRFGTEARMDNPARICKAMRAEMGQAAFTAMWGTNPNKRNAFGKCVSHHAKMKQQATTAAQKECKGLKGQERRQCVATSATARFEARATTLAAAAEGCAAELRSSRSAFLQKYGKGAKKNVKAAFASCVRSKR